MGLDGLHTQKKKEVARGCKYENIPGNSWNARHNFGQLPEAEAADLFNTQVGQLSCSCPSAAHLLNKSAPLA